MKNLVAVMLSFVVVMLLVAVSCVDAAPVSQTYVVDSVANCGQPGDPVTQQLYIPKFAVNVTLPSGVWGVRPAGGAFTYKYPDAWWSFAVRLTPASCEVVSGASSGPYACLSGLATNVIGSPQIWNSSAEAFQAASGSEVHTFGTRRFSRV